MTRRRLTILSVAVGVPLGLGLVMAEQYFGEPPVSPLYLLLFFVLFLMVHVTLHETGHVIGAIAAQLEPVNIRIGPLEFQKAGTTWRAKLTGVAFFGGGVICIPRSEDRLRERLAVCIASGAAANLLTCLSVLPLLSLSVMGFIFGTFCFTGLLLSFIALYPREVAGISTDGRKLLQLFEGGPVSDRMTASLLLLAASFRGVRASAWPPEIVEQLLAVQTNSAEDYHALGFAYIRAIDEGNLKEARNLHDQARAKLAFVPPSSIHGYTLEAAFLAAVEGNATEAEALLSQVSPKKVRTSSLMRVGAAVALAAGKPDEAVKLSLQGLQAAEREWDPLSLPVDVEWLSSRCPNNPQRSRLSP
ncbi:MAG: hypothetical protein H7Y20_09915 [Bryobacteraceae bacterium]|nr:hypothetical protein [Bryobacteraceae bacterium]